MIALCAILLLAPDSHGQGIKISKRTFTISGTVGVAGVTLQGFPVSGTTVTTDDNGVYTVQVDYGWSGTVKPIKPGYTFEPSERTYTKVVANATSDNYKPNVQTFKISGTISGIAGPASVKLIGFPEEVVSDAQGHYTATVVYGWSGTVLAEKTGYRFEPPTFSYGQINKEMTDQNFKAYELMYTISGTVKTAGVSLTVTGLPKPVVSGVDGSYRVEVRYGWSGKIKPVKEGVQFTPEEHSYTGVMENQMSQDFEARVFTYEITGTAGLAGVIMKGLPDDPITNENGYYAATVTHGWSGKVTPEKAGQKFDPPSKQYTNVKTKFENQDYKPSAIYLTISGTAGTSNVTLAGLPGDPQGDATGAFTAKVPYGWGGTVTPTKLGWSFEPPSYEYGTVTQDQVRVNFKPARITYKITGNVGMPQVTLMGLPGQPVSGPTGEYSADVDFNWKGTVIPRRDGYTFEPASREYTDLQMSQTNQDYQAHIMQHSIAGRVVDETGAPLAGVIVAAEGEPTPVASGPDGKFDLQVAHKWQGRVTFQKDGYTLTPTTKSFPLVTANPPEVNITAKIKVMTITDRIVYTEGALQEPIAGVRVTAIPPGTNSVVTDATGKYSVKVPYGWSGVLLFEKPEIVFDPNTKAFTNVTEDIDNINPSPARPPEPAPPAPTTMAQPPVTTTTTPPPVETATTAQPPVETTTTAQPPVETTTAAQPPGNAQAIQQQIEQLNAEQIRLGAEINALRQKGQQPPADKLQRYNAIPKEIGKLLTQARSAGPEDQGATPAPQPRPAASQGPIVDQSPLPDLLSVLADLARQTGVTIAVDMTVKPEPVSVSFPSLVGQPVSVALQRIVDSTKTTYKVDPVDDRTYKVYRPISNMFPGVELVNALQDLSTASGVPIIADPNVTGQVNINFENVSLEDALEMMLAGKPYVFKRMPRYYLVADRGITSRVFPEISETRRVRLNYIQATRAKQLLSPVFAPFVQAEAANARD
ncbi:MAG: hypothetical protein M1376_19170, partial [Planctomycetes bacterium]|nr:hypothetical protein [Planctomycetota bacterium]